jgi:hypothetical protein
MTNESGQAVTNGRAEEIARYVDAVREELADLPASARDELLEDLPAHLAEVAAEDPAPLRDRLGAPTAYAAELRAAAELTVDEERRPLAARLAARWERTRERLRRLDGRTGPLVGYERFSDFARLLVPAWWVLRGYLAAMFVATLLYGSPTGLLPRLGSSTLAGVLMLVGFVVGSIWLAHRTPGLSRWPRRAVHLASALLVLGGIAGFASLDASRWGWPDAQVNYVYDSPYDNVRDVYIVDENGQLLTNVQLLDQDGRPIEIGWDWCGEYLDEYVYEGERVWVTPQEEWYYVAYPRCPEDLPFWARAMGQPEPSPEPTAGPSPGPTAGPSPGPTAGPSPEPSPTG